MSARILFLHLSDVHIRHAVDVSLSRGRAVAQATFPYLPEVEAVSIVVSGDIAFSGVSVEYELAKLWIKDIIAGIRSQVRDLPVYVSVCPGNHDCDFDRSDDTRESVLARIRSDPASAKSESLIKTATAIQKDFFDFKEEISFPSCTSETPLSWQQSVTVNGHKVVIRSLNVAWMSDLREKQGALVFPSDAVSTIKGDNRLTLTLLHHPYNWFSQNSYRNLQQLVRSESQIAFTGHEHVPNVGEIFDTQSPMSVFVEAGAFAESGSNQVSWFNLVLVDLEKLEYLSKTHQWFDGMYVNNDDAEIWGSLRKLTTYSDSKCSLLPEFENILKDAGANFSHSAKKDLQLDDFYVWPELIVSDDTSPVKRNVHGSIFTDVKNLNSGVLIKGDEKSGKTSLLYQLYKSYHQRGYLPLYFKGSWFQKQHADSPLRALNFALERQYVRSGHNHFQQEDRAKRILLLDNFDSSALTPSVLSECIKSLSKYFGAVILTATDSDAATDTLSIDQVEALQDFTSYQIREFGHKKRYELVCKWAELGGQNESNSTAWMTTIDKWEKDLTAAVGRQFVPAVPIFLVTLLQSMEVGRSADLQNSAFGHYYHFLITSSLNNVGIDREQWSEVFNYCSKLAWFIHSNGRSIISDKELRHFTEQYRLEFSSEVVYDRRLRDLIKAGILTPNESDYSFRYPYLYYYFIGQHLGENIHDAAIQSEIRSLCLNLDSRENANTLLFACHHTRSPLIFTEIASTLDSCYASDRLFDLERDSSLLNSLIGTAPSLIYHEDSVKVTRGALRDEQDSNLSTEEHIQKANSALVRLFRSMEILGQFLKNHYGTTKNSTKEELIQKVMEGSLRGLFNLIGSLLDNVEVFFKHVEHDAAKRGESADEKVEAAKRLIFDMVSMITFAFIHKASSSIGSVHLRDNIKRVEEDYPTLANQMMRLSYELDLPDGLSLNNIRRLNDSVKKNVFARALLRQLALKHLHLFKVQYKDRQKLCELLDISINNQRGVQHQHNRQINSSNGRA
jgi:hypothetical protein